MPETGVMGTITLFCETKGMNRMDMSTVALVPVSSYDQAEVDAAVRTGVELLGGIGAFVKKEEKILLKPNLLSGALPQKAITTHPAVFSAVCRLLREAGYAHLSYGDSPGNPVTTPEKAADVSGISEAAEKWHLEKADFDAGSVVRFPEGKTAHSFYLCRGVQEADALINLCKMKTHALERITGDHRRGEEPLRLRLRREEGGGPCPVPLQRGLRGYAGGPEPVREAPAAHHGRDRCHGRERPHLRCAPANERDAVLRGGETSAGSRV